MQAYDRALPRLRSAFDGQIWEMPGWTKASAKGGHVAPALKCHCGFFGYFRLENMHSMSALYPQVLGAAIAAGRVQLHERGPRAQYMKPSAFCLPTIPPQTERGPSELVFQADLDRQRSLMAQADQDIRTLAGECGAPLFDEDDHLLTFVSEWA